MKNDCLTPNFKPQTYYAGFHLSFVIRNFSFVISSQRTTGWDAMFTFSGKERDQETGYSYFGARYYDSDLSIWLSVDPMAEIYPSLSPYVYCDNNPVKLVDPDGRELVITGGAGDEAFCQLSNKTSKHFELVRGDDGSVNYVGKARSKEDKHLKKVIDSKETVNIVAENSNKFTAHDGVEYQYSKDLDGNYLSGAYGGSTVSSDGQVNSYQYVNPQRAGEMDINVGDKQTGGYMLHEVAEGYFSGQAAGKKGGDPVGGSRYTKLHAKANKVCGGDYIKVMPTVKYGNFSFQKKPYYSRYKIPAE